MYIIIKPADSKSVIFHNILPLSNLTYHITHIVTQTWRLEHDPVYVFITILLTTHSATTYQPDTIFA